MVLRMTTDEILRYDEDAIPLGDRVASPGWPLREGLRIVKANDPEVTVSITGVVRDEPPPPIDWRRYGGIDPHTPPRDVTHLFADSRSDTFYLPVILVEDHLAAMGHIVGHVEPRRAVLDAFLRLAPDPTDAAILDYASHYGMLGLYLTDRAPRGMYSSPGQFGEQFPPGSRYRHAPGILLESLRLWRQVIAEIAAAYSIAGHLRRDRPAPLAVWAWLAEIALVSDGDPDWPWLRRGPPPSTDVECQRQALAHVLNEWLAFGAVRPVFVWGTYKQPEPAVPLGATTLFGGLVLQLLLAVGGQVGFAICSECATAYVPHRRPPTGAYGASRRNYCPTCRQRGLPRRAAERHYRERRARLRATTQEGS